MSRAFVKEPDGDQPDDGAPERPISPNPNFVTPEGLAAIDAAITDHTARLTEAKATGDKLGQASAARELRYWTARRASAQPIDMPTPDGEVRFGSTITFEREDGRRQTFRITGEDEADPANGAVSYVSPLARALLGKRAGDAAELAGSEIEIVEVA